MLALSRKIGEAIICTDGSTIIKIVVSKIRKNQVVLAIDAPSFTIDREEIRERKLRGETEVKSNSKNSK